MDRRRFIQGAGVAAAVAAACIRPARGAMGFFGGGATPPPPYWWAGPYDGYTPAYYISSTANPANDGTTNTGSISAPWSINALNTQWSTYQGKVVGLMDGAYSLYTILGLPGAGNFSGGNWVSVAPGSNTGTYTTPTVVVSESLHGAVIDGQRDAIYAADPSLDWGEGLLGPGTSETGYFYGSGLIIDGLLYKGGNYRFITNYGGAYPAGRGGNGNNGCDNLTVRNCYFTDLSYITAQLTGKNTAEVYSEGSYHIYIENCYFDTFSAPSDGGRCAAVQFFSPTLDTLVEYTTIIGPTEGGNMTYWKAGAAPGHQQAVLRYNYIDASASTSSGGVPFMSDGCTVTTDTLQIYGNILIVAQGNAAIWFDNTGVDGYQGVWEFYNNTIAGNWSSKGLIYSTDNWAHPPTGVNFYNNILTPSTGGGQTGDFQTPTLSLIQTVNYNLYPAASVSFGVGNVATYSTLAAWQSATSGAGHAADANSAQGNPLFVASGGEVEYYRLQPGSPALTMASDGGQIGAWRNDGVAPYQRGSSY